MDCERIATALLLTHAAGFEQAGAARFSEQLCPVAGD
jgi:hypothetical protein